MPQEQLLPFADFIKSVENSNRTMLSLHADTKVASDQHFDQMKQHILKHYRGVNVHHSFVDDNGQIFDCMPAEEQPALKKSGQKLAQPPDLPNYQTEKAESNKQETKQANTPIASERKDKFGNAMSCPPGSVPIRRLTLEEMSRFETLEQFFQKSPFDKGQHPRLGSHKQLAAQNVAATHKYAHAFQNVNNLGGHSFLSLWKPVIGAGQIFSLSQHWYAGGSGGGLQTVECGWQVYPQKYGNSNPCLFIYYTADGYNHTGCYNHDCSAFVQTSNSFTLGGSLGPLSVYGGAQFEIELAWYLSGGRWWLYFHGTAGSNALGYYPVSLFNNGALASHATNIDYGGEVVGTNTWPGMGSSHFANQGWQKSAYHRLISYYPSAGGNVQAALTPSQPSPNCYTINVNSGGGWGEYFYFGGPGGGNC